jgi:hypothetical protein
VAQPTRRQYSAIALICSLHNWVMQGDDRGIYGPQGADLMHYIEQPSALTPPTQRRVSGPFQM